MKPSMWCNECSVWTKHYKENGEHKECGKEVFSEGQGNPDIDYEGMNEKF